MILQEGLDVKILNVSVSAAGRNFCCCYLLTFRLQAKSQPEVLNVEENYPLKIIFPEFKLRSLSIFNAPWRHSNNPLYIMTHNNNSVPLFSPPLNLHEDSLLRTRPLILQ